MQSTANKAIFWTAGALVTVLGAAVTWFTIGVRDAHASPLVGWGGGHAWKKPVCSCDGEDVSDTVGGTWYWLRSPDEEKRVIAGLYNRYCIRCHGVDGRGVWDIPDVPDFTNSRWQASRSDAQLARLTLEGRGAVMPPFRGALSLEEAWGMARYLRTFVPGTEVSRPRFDEPGKPVAAELPAPKKIEPAPK